MERSNYFYNTATDDISSSSNQASIILPLDETHRDLINNTLNELASSGYRVIGFARKYMIRQSDQHTTALNDKHRSSRKNSIHDNNTNNSYDHERKDIAEGLIFVGVSN